MKKKRKRNILFLITLIVFINIATIFWITQTEINIAKTNLQDEAKIITNLVEEHIKLSGFKLDNINYLQSITEEFAHSKEIKWLEFFDKEQTVIAHTNKKRVGKAPLPIHQKYVKKVFKTSLPVIEWDDSLKRYNRFIPLVRNAYCKRYYGASWWKYRDKDKIFSRDNNHIELTYL